MSPKSPRSDKETGPVPTSGKKRASPAHSKVESAIPSIHQDIDDTARLTFLNPLVQKSPLLMQFSPQPTKVVIGSPRPGGLRSSKVAACYGGYNCCGNGIHE